MPPLAVKVTPKPAQTTVGFVTAVIVGNEKAKTETVEEFGQPPPLSPITVYVDVVVGVSTDSELVPLLGNQV